MSCIQTTIANVRDEILEHLAFAIRRDAAKGGDGSRSTVEVAERLGVSTAAARRALNELLEAELIDWLGPLEGFGSVHFWRLTENGPDDDGRREPANDNGALEIAA